MSIVSAARRLRDSGITRVPLPASTWWLLGALTLLPVASLVPVGAVQALVALPIALVAPGGALLLAASGPGKRHEPALALALSVMLSLALYALLGLGFAALSVSLSRRSVLIGISALTLLALAGSWLRAWQVRPMPDWPDVSRAMAPAALFPVQSEGRRGGLSWAYGYGAAALLALVALVAAQRLAPRPVDPPFTQFSLAGAWAGTSGIVAMDGRAELAVPVAITNRTHSPQRYRITPILDARDWPARAAVVRNAASWEGSVRGPVPADGCLHRLAITLSQEGSRAPVASLVVWIRGGHGRTACAATNG